MNFKERLREEIEYKGLLIKEISALAGVNNNTFLSYKENDSCAGISTNKKRPLVKN